MPATKARPSYEVPQAPTVEATFLLMLADFRARVRRSPDVQERALLYLVAACPRIVEGPLELSFHQGFSVNPYKRAIGVLSSGEYLICTLAQHLFNDAQVRQVSVYHLCDRLDSDLFKAAIVAMQIRAGAKLPVERVNA